MAVGTEAISSCTPTNNFSTDVETSVSATPTVSNTQNITKGRKRRTVQRGIGVYIDPNSGITYINASTFLTLCVLHVCLT